MRTPAFCICENKNADQLHGFNAADQHLGFSYIDSTQINFLNAKFQASSCLLWLQSSVCVIHGGKPKRKVFS